MPKAIPRSGSRASRRCAVAGGQRARRLPGARAPTSTRANTSRKRSERLRWLTGFSGSAGVALILRDQAIIFVDGRYPLQVRGEVDTDAVCDRAPDRDAAARLAFARGSARVRGSASTHGCTRSPRSKALTAAAGKVGAELVPVAENPIDRLWADQPAAAVGAGGDPAARLRRRAGQGKARPARRRSRQGRCHA